MGPGVAPPGPISCAERTARGIGISCGASTPKVSFYRAFKRS